MLQINHQRYMKKTLLAAIFVFVFLASAFGQQEAIAKRLTIIHTNDLQSKLSGFGPNADYTPLRTGDDRTIGGIARVATVIKDLKSRAPEGRIVRVESWNPLLFYQNATYVTWGATGAAIVMMAGVCFAVVIFWRKRRKSRSR